MMNITVRLEDYLIAAFIIIPLLSLILMPRKHIHEAVFAYIALKTTTWLWSILSVEFNQIAFPYHPVLEHATNIDVQVQFILLPTIFAWFYVLFPRKRNWFIKIYYFLFFTVFLQTFHIFMLAFTAERSLVPPKDLNTVGEILSAYIGNIYYWPVQLIFCHLLTYWFFRPYNKR